MPLNMQKIAAFDLETKGIGDSRYALQPFRLKQGKAAITSYALAWISKGELATRAVQNPTYEQHKAVLEHAIDNDITLVGWNMAFDVAWLIAQGHLDLARKVKWLDGMLLWQHLEREPEYEIPGAKKKSWSLKTAVADYFPKFEGYGENIDFESEDPATVKRRMNYNKMDVGFTLKLAQIFYNRLEAEGAFRLRNALIEASAIEPVADSMVNGLSVNVQWARELDAKLEDERVTLEEKLAEEGATPKILASPVQLRKLLYEDWGLPVLKTTDKGAPSTDKEALYMMAAEDERAPLVQRYREIKGNRTKFVDKVLESVAYNEDGQSRPSMRIYGTYTGRATFASAQGKNKDKVQTGFALHQMKGDPDYRRIITVPEGYTLVEWDAASQEYRWMAIESGDPVMLSLCEDGEDPHSYMGAQIGHVEYQWLIDNKDTDKDAKKIRKSGKVGNLSCQYRIGIRTLRVRANVNHGMPINDKEAGHIHRTYHGTYRRVQQYWMRQIHKCKRQGFAETIAGRRVQLNGSWSNKKTGWKLESTAVNFPIQGIGADQKYLAIKLLRNVLPQVGGHFYFELHDGLYAILPTKTAMRDGLRIRQMLSNMPYQKAWGFTPPVPMPWDMKIGPNWGDLKEVA